jgi:serine/threonine protein kinase
MDSKQVLARFDAERQALALMDHPNIAKVLDGGLHQHRPFFVMELVKGVPITDFCDARKLTPKERLELFVPVCQAIQHAHQKGIIHRDIKPSNVLIALYDDKPVVKVIDFGVAKATGGTLTEHTIETGFGGVVGTPQYMSPEQATFNNLDIDTRSDVYALGVLLYELLTGSPPFTKKELQKAGLLEILRVVREEEPPRPSAKLSTAEALPSLSANRGTEPKKLTGLLRNELDWIVMKALEKDRARRYETANGFAADVMRYLGGEAVLAHPPSTGYLLKKFVKRYKGQVLAASVVFFALVAGIVGTTLGLLEAKKQEAEAKRQEGLALGAAEEERQAKLREAERAEGEKAAKLEAQRPCNRPRKTWPSPRRATTSWVRCSRGWTPRRITPRSEGSHRP